jgi:hypothetical protein
MLQTLRHLTDAPQRLIAISSGEAEFAFEAGVVDGDVGRPNRAVLAAIFGRDSSNTGSPHAPTCFRQLGIKIITLWPIQHISFGSKEQTHSPNW